MQEKAASIKYVIGIDGGGTKTDAALADINGKILKRVILGPSNPNKVGEKLAIERLGQIIQKVSKSVSKKEIKFIHIALAGSLERDMGKRVRIKNALLRRYTDLKPLAGQIEIEGDQRAAFRSGTDERDGVLLIAGTGSIAMGWRGKKEFISGGWDYIMGDQGSAFWIGQNALRIVCRELDGRKETQGMAKLVMKSLGAKNIPEFVAKIYSEKLVEVVASLASVVDRAAESGDRAALQILENAGKELAPPTATVIKKLGFQKHKFPLVLVGGVFKSKTVLKTFGREIHRIAPGAQFFKPKREPVAGAVMLALDGANK